MAHQAHNLPWGSLASNFQYTKRQGSDYYDIYVIDKADRVSSLIRFAKTFAKNIREYAASERRKYATAEEYRRRAKTWMQSDRRPDTAGQDAAQPQPKGVSMETRTVFSDHDRELWRARRKVYDQDRLIDETQYIDNWILGDKNWVDFDISSEPYVTSTWQIRDRWVGNWTDSFKALMMEAALVTTPLHKRQSKRDQPDPEHLKYMDTLFLLAHHPHVPLLHWTWEADSCCNIESGLVCVAEAALKGYLYFNLLYAMRESGSKICNFTEHFVDPHKWRGRQVPPSTKLSPRPMYMNTPSWYRLLDEISSGHSHHPENMMFGPLLFPQEGENFTLAYAESPPQVDPGVWDIDNMFQRQEVDVMTPSPGNDEQDVRDSLTVRGSSVALHEFLRGLWKLMVNYEMLWTDHGSSPSWEAMVARSLESCFDCLTGYRYQLFWDTPDQMFTHKIYDIFDGKVEREQGHTTGEGQGNSQQKTQKAKNQAIRREARRQARADDKSKVCSNKK